MDWKFLIEKLTSWPVLAFISFAIIFIIFYKPIKRIFNTAGQVKVGSFELTVNEIGQSLGIDNVVSEINDLSYEELKLFVVVGGEDADYYIFSPQNIPPDQLSIHYEKFDRKGLIELIEPKEIEGYSKMKENFGSIKYGFKTTDKGRRVHKVLMETIFHELTKSKLKR